MAATVWRSQQPYMHVRHLARVTEPTLAKTPSERVELATREDLPEVHRFLHKHLFSDYPLIMLWWNSHAHEFCNGKRPIWIIRDDDGELAGVLAARFINHHDAKISALLVKEDRRGHGLGTALLESFERKARENENTEMHLNVYADDKASVWFYFARGWQVVKEHYHEVENPHRKRFVMVKKL